MKDFKIKTIKTIEDLQIELSEFDKVDFEKVNQAYKFLEEHVENTKRESGDNYYTHCLTISWNVAQITANTEAVVSAILHNVIQRAGVSIDIIDEQFGTEVAFILDELAKIKELSKSIDAENTGDEVTNLIFNAAEDIRIIIIRLADKLDGILTVDSLKEEEQERTAKKILNIYAPLSEYMGLGSIQRIMQDEAFRILYHNEYVHLVELIGGTTERESKQLKKRSETF